MRDNFILKTDSYKISHWPQYPPGTEYVESYLESRGGKWDSTVVFGPQWSLQTHFLGCRVTQDKIDEADEVLAMHFGTRTMFNRAGWEHIVNDHGGLLPLSVRVPLEGSVIPVHNALMVARNTCPRCYWLTNYAETLLMQNWYPMTVATQSREIKKIILKWLEHNGDPRLIDFKLHDFGFRGVSSYESAGIGGAAHLVNFKGTDTLAALLVAHDHYYADLAAGYSIPAAEHSTITSWGRAHEGDAYQNMLDTYPGGLVAVVSDSYDIENAVRHIWGQDLRERVLSRPGTVVIRPDSGYPPTVVRQVVSDLADAFGFEINAKGYKVLNEHVRVIQGDGVDIDSIDEILLALSTAGFSADNVAFGMGGALLQKLDRDTQRFAFKCSSITVNGVERDVFKQPASDLAKSSKAGRLALVFEDGEYRTVRQEERKMLGLEDQLIEVFRDGDIIHSMTFDEIRKRAA
jgi:nicotinamide phosphoribosyltransferase